jgi:hypothetical protein
MSGRIAHRRAAKAARRKKLLAERRKTAVAERQLPLAERMQRLGTAPLHSCLIREDAECGISMVILTREAKGGGLVLASFLVDVHCLGVKDVLFRHSDRAEIEDIVAAMEEEAPFTAVDPSYARKLLRDCVAYARSIGIEPHPDYAATELLFGEASADACDASFVFGYEGKPLYVPGPTETPAKIRQRLEQLRRTLGEDGFHFAMQDDDDFLDEGEGEGETEYDALEAPDPTEWLELDEGEAMQLVEAYHRRAGISVPNEAVHATIHVAVEKQIALDDPPATRRAMARLMAEGLDRHEALHAVGSILAGHIWELAQAGASRAASPDDYAAAVDRLTAKSWRREFGKGDE